MVHWLTINNNPSNPQSHPFPTNIYIYLCIQIDNIDIQRIVMAINGLGGQLFRCFFFKPGEGYEGIGGAHRMMA